MILGLNDKVSAKKYLAPIINFIWILFKQPLLGRVAVVALYDYRNGVFTDM